MAEVVLHGVGKTYPGDPPVDAVRDVDLTVRDGEFVVLVGPSGCGKSTLLRMVAGLEEVSEGDVRIGGRSVLGVAPRDRDVAMVFQDYALYPHMSVRENLSLGLRLRKTPRDEIDRRVHDAAALLDLSDLLDRRPAALSGGQRQRVAVGRAIVRQPACFLFDEPLSNLDARLRLHMRAELKALHQRLKTTTIYVTHDQEEAMTLGTRIVVLAEGRVQQIGPPLEVYRRPANRFVAGFLGTPPMNFVPPSALPSLGLDGDHVLGIRPEHIERGGAGTPVALTVDVVEPLGDRMDLALRTAGGVPLVARVPADDALAPGTSLDFTVDPARVHRFEPGDFGARRG